MINGGGKFERFGENGIGIGRGGEGKIGGKVVVWSGNLVMMGNGKMRLRSMVRRVFKKVCIVIWSLGFWRILVRSGVIWLMIKGGRM